MGRIARGTLEEGQLVQRSDVAEADGAVTEAQVSVPVEPGKALNGAFAPADRVDVIATFTDAGAPRTTTVSRDAVVVRVVSGDETIGGSGAVTVVLAVPPGDLEPLAAASASGTITIARTTGLERQPVEGQATAPDPSAPDTPAPAVEGPRAEVPAAEVPVSVPVSAPAPAPAEAP